MPAIVTLATDFGTADGYVGEMKGVVLSLAPAAVIVDVTHEIAPQDIVGARLTVERCWRRFPPGTVHLVVVDPGVGSARAALAVESEGRFLVGPDNGVLSAALTAPGARVVALPVPAWASATFHGRDVFAPAAARLASGVSLAALGGPAGPRVVLEDPPTATLADGRLGGEVVHVDRFGNAITNVRQGDVAGRSAVEAAGRPLPLVTTYAHVAQGEALALVGSSGRLEIAVRGGHAASTLGLVPGTRIVVT